MCISFAKQCGECPVNPLTPLRGLEPAPARCKSSSKLGSYLLTRSLNPFGLEPAPARCKSSSKLGSYLLTRSLHPSPFTFHFSLFTPHLSPLTSHPSPLILSPLTFHPSPFPFTPKLYGVDFFTLECKK